VSGCVGLGAVLWSGGVRLGQSDCGGADGAQAGLYACCGIERSSEGKVQRPAW
jgi:hypothetical protein